MTGFARTSRAFDNGEVVVSVKSVNHRGLDVHFHMPTLLDPFEPAAREAIRKRLVRGHIQVHITLERLTGEPERTVNVDLLEQWMTAFSVTAERMRSHVPPDPNSALRIPGMLQSDSKLGWSDELAGILNACLTDALDALDTFRAREGDALANEIHSRAEIIQKLTDRMESIRDQAAHAFHARLKERLSELLGNAQIEPHRLAQEAAILVDRSDVSEEIMRLRTHAAQVFDLLAARGEKGKKLDFLFQEMNRETNTILSKTGGLGEQGLTLTDLALTAKAEIDKMREQSLNIE